MVTIPMKTRINPDGALDIVTANSREFARVEGLQSEDGEALSV